MSFIRKSAVVGARATGLPCRWRTFHAERLQSSVAAPPVFVVRHAQSVQCFNEGLRIKLAHDTIEDVVPRLGARRARKSDAEWEAGCEEISRRLSGGKDGDRWIDDSHLPAELRIKDAELTPAGIADTLKRAETQLQELPSEGPRRVLLIVSPLTRTMMTAALLFHRLPTQGVDIDVVLEPDVIETVLWPHDMGADNGTRPDEAFAEVRELVSDVSLGPGVEDMVKRLDQAAKALPGSWWQKPASPGQGNKAALFLKWVKAIADEQSVNERREGIIRSIRRHVIGRENHYCAVYVVCHGMTIVKLAGEPTGPLNLTMLPKNLECRRVDILEVS